MPTVLAKLSMLLACAVVAALHSSGRSWRLARSGPPLDAGSTALGILFAVSIANNAMGFLSDAYVQWLCGEHEVMPTNWDLFCMQLPVLLVTVTLVGAMFRELRRHLDRPGSRPERLRGALVRAMVLLLVALPIGALAEERTGLLATALRLLAVNLKVLALEIAVVTVVLWMRGQPQPSRAE